MLTQITRFFVFSLILLPVVALDAIPTTRRSGKDPLVRFDDNAGSPRKRRTRRSVSPESQSQSPVTPIAPANTVAEHNQEATPKEQEEALALGYTVGERIADAIKDGSITTKAQLNNILTREAAAASDALKQQSQQNIFSRCLSRCLARWNKAIKK